MDALQNLDYPSEKEDWWIDILIGGLISMIPFFNFVALGYMMEATEMGIRNVQQVPTWENMGDKFVRGFWFFVISLVYFLLPMIVLLIFLVPLISEAIVSGDISTPSGVAAAIGGLVYFVLLLMAAFLLPMGVARHVATGSLGAAFRLGSVFADIKAVASDYIVASLLYVFLGGLLMVLVSWIPVVNMMVYFYWSVAFYNYFGRLYAQVVAKPLAGTGNIQGCQQI